MAEAAVGFLVQTIGSLLENEAALLGAVRSEISELKLELESTRSFLRDADKFQNDGVRVWMTQVRDAAFKAEDIIDEFMYQIDRLTRVGGGFKGFLRRVIYLPKELSLKHRTSIKLQGIKAEIKAIAERSKRYSFGNIEEFPSTRHTSSWAQNISESSFFTEDDVVGIEKEKDLLIKWLVDGEMQRTVISVWGMGGSGKTTLVSKAYRDRNVKRHFDCSAWISVSQSYDIGDLFRRMIEEFFNGEEELVPTGLSSMGYIMLVKILIEFLQQKRYVVVLDDVWDNNFWRQINVALPDGRHGSRIIITTRKEDIASYPYGVGGHVLHPKPLRKSDAWTLFCKKAFCNNASSAQCPPELENLALALVEKCEGLPLAIVAMGSLMATKEKSELKWRAISDSLNWHLSNNPMLEVVKTILFLSFNDLQYYLKNCFLYCCLFPENRWIAGTKLVQLWMAEGFVEERRGQTPEEVGKSYLKELISRSLIQTVKKNQIFLGPKLCKLHDLMREIALSISERDNFCSIYHQPGINEGRRTRHLSVHTVDGTLLCRDMSQVRSFLAFNFDTSSTFYLNTLLSSFGLIRVLDLKDAPIDNLPKHFGKLFNLRYLSLRGTHIKELPKSFERLRNLQTLDLKRTEVKALPRGIVKLQNLRHLITCSAAENEEFTQVIGIQVPADVWKLKNLQVLSCIEANSDVVKGIGSLTQIKKIYLTKVREEDELPLCASIEKLELLCGLLVMVTHEEETLRMDALSSPPSSLRKLALIGRLKNVPPWFCKLHSIARLHLHWSRLPEDPIPHLSVLPKLKHLTLVNAYDNGKVKLCFNEGFPELQQLSLVLLPELIEIIISEGVMPQLRCLNLHVCAKLKAVPQGIEHLTKLEELDLKDVSEELIKGIEEEESIDRPRVKHIPVINYYFKTPSGYNCESLS